MSTRIAMIGGHGKIALIATRLLTEQGMQVRSIVRSAQQFDTVREYGGEPVLADIESAETDFDALLEGADVVIWSAGAGGGDPARTRAVDLEAAKRMIDAAIKNSVRDFLMVSYRGAGPSHGLDPEHPMWQYAEAKSQADAALRSSSLDWVIVAPAALTLETGRGTISADITVPDGHGDDAAVDLPADGTPVAREDVAALIAQLIEPMVQGRLHHATVSASGGDTAVADVAAAAVQAVRDS
ncbi:MAG: SDR family oxidoreductase [Agrococcus casei]